MTKMRQLGASSELKSKSTASVSRGANGASASSGRNITGQLASASAGQKLGAPGSYPIPTTNTSDTVKGRPGGTQNGDTGPGRGPTGAPTSITAQPVKSGPFTGSVGKMASGTSPSRIASEAQRLMAQRTSAPTNRASNPVKRAQDDSRSRKVGTPFRGKATAPGQLKKAAGLKSASTIARATGAPKPKAKPAKPKARR